MSFVVDGVFHIKGRGLVVSTRSDNRPVLVGCHVLRESDGAVWRVRGLERFAFAVMPNEPIGMLLDGPLEPAAGDALERVWP